MLEDRWGLENTADNQDAVAHFSETVMQYLQFSKTIGHHLKDALTADPKMVLALVLRGYFFQLFCNPALEKKAEQSLAQARESLAERGGTERERLHVDALAAWRQGNWEATTEAWEQILFAYPRDILALRLAHFTHFYAGEPMRMRDTAARVLEVCDDATPGYGFVEGIYAFGLEESGDYSRAERFGRQAVARNGADIWAVHAVAHVMEMQGRHQEGVAWLTDTEAGWAPEANNFAYHVWWHRCLFHLDRDEFDQVLALYDTHVRGDQESEDYLDVTNGIAMLWRLESHGVAVGDRWQELAEKAATHCHDHLLAFADAHYMVALSRSGDAAEAQAMLDSLSGAATGATSQGRALMAAGHTICQGIDALRRGAPDQAVDLLMPIRYQVKAIGGSHAQRDLFQQILIEAALAAGRHVTARALLAERAAEKPNSAWTWRRLATARAALGDTAGAEAAEGAVAQALAA